MGTFAKQKLVVGFLFWAAIFWQKDTSSVPSQINEAVGRSEKKKKKTALLDFSVHFLPYELPLRYCVEVQETMLRCRCFVKWVNRKAKKTNSQLSNFFL